MIIRAATHADRGGVADIYLDSRAAALSYINWAHDAASVRDWIATELMARCDVFVAEDNGRLAGFVALDPPVLELLFVGPTYFRQGVGRRLLDRAKAHCPEGFRLWCFQRNEPARAFYERHGLTVDHMTDGADNEEREPDVLYVWQSAGNAD